MHYEEARLALHAHSLLQCHAVVGRMCAPACVTLYQPRGKALAPKMMRLTVASGSSFIQNIQTTAGIRAAGRFAAYT